MNPQYFLVLAVMVVMGWFGFGIIYNLRRGDAVLKWMQTGLPRIGEKTTFRWLGTSVAELVIARAKPPFRRLETLLVMKPRDVFWMTIMAAIQGRDDVVIFRAQLSSAPLLDLELADPKTWSGRSSLQHARQRGGESKSYHDLQLMAALSLLIVTVWLKQQKKNPAFALWPTLFMYITTLAATLVTARNLYVTIVPMGGVEAAGAWAMILISALLFVSAILIGWDGYMAYQRFAKGTGQTKKAAAAPAD